MSKSAYRWLVVVSCVIPALSMLGDATVFSHLIPPEIKEAVGRHAAQQIEDAGWGTLALAAAGIALLLAVPVLLYGLFRFKAWAPKFSIWFCVLAYVFVPFAGVSVQSGITYSAVALGSMLWGMVVVLPYVSPEVRAHFWPGDAASRANTQPTGHEVGNG